MVDFDPYEYVKENAQQRPYNKNGLMDGDWDFIHMTFVHDLIKRMSKPTESQKNKVKDIVEKLKRRYIMERDYDITTYYNKWEQGLIKFEELTDKINDIGNSYSSRIKELDMYV